MTQSGRYTSVITTFTVNEFLLSLLKIHININLLFFTSIPCRVDGLVGFSIGTEDILFITLMDVSVVQRVSSFILGDDQALPVGALVKILSSIELVFSAGVCEATWTVPFCTLKFVCIWST